MGWLKNQLVAISMAMASVEQNALGQTKNQLSDGVGTVQRHMQGNLMDSLLNGEVTEEVKLLRARLYKVAEATDNLSVQMSVDEEGNQTYEVKELDYKSQLSKIQLDTFDDYKPELVFYNEHESDSSNDTLTQFLPNSKVIPNPKFLPNLPVGNISNLRFLEGSDEPNPKFNPDIPEGEYFNIEFIAIGKSDDMIKKPLIIHREFLPRFRLEQYVSKVVSRKITSKERLMEFYISKFPDEKRKNDVMFLKHFKREMGRPEKSDLFELTGLEFITTPSSLGLTHGILFEMNEAKFDKIVDFKSYYIVKYKMRITNVEDVKDYFTHDGLDELYAQNAPRKRK